MQVPLCHLSVLLQQLLPQALAWPGWGRAWQEPSIGALLCPRRVGVIVLKAALQPQGLGVQCGVQGHLACPRHCCYHWPCRGPPLPPAAHCFPLPACISGGPGTAHASIWEPGLSIYLELALRFLTRGHWGSACFSLARGAGAGRLWKRGLGGRDGDALPWLRLAESICLLVPQFRI